MPPPRGFNADTSSPTGFEPACITSYKETEIYHSCGYFDSINMLRPRIHDASYSSVAIKRIPKKVTHKSYHIYTLLLIQICRYNVKRSDSLDTPNINARERFNPHPSNNSSMTAAVHFLHIRRLHASMRPSMSTFALRLTLINSISICSRLNVPYLPRTAHHDSYVQKATSFHHGHQLFPAIRGTLFGRK